MVKAAGFPHKCRYHRDEAEARLSQTHHHHGRESWVIPRGSSTGQWDGLAFHNDRVLLIRYGNLKLQSWKYKNWLHSIWITRNWYNWRQNHDEEFIEADVVDNDTLDHSASQVPRFTLLKTCFTWVCSSLILHSAAEKYKKYLWWLTIHSGEYIGIALHPPDCYLHIRYPRSSVHRRKDNLTLPYYTSTYFTPSAHRKLGPPQPPSPLLFYLETPLGSLTPCRDKGWWCSLHRCSLNGLGISFFYPHCCLTDLWLVT